MLRFRFQAACLALVASCTLGNASLLAAEAVKSDLSLSTPLQSPGSAAAARPNTPGALLKTFNSPVAEPSLNKRTSLTYQVGTAASVAGEPSKINPLIEAEALPVPEPTALFLAGFSGCVLLALAQRLRGPKASLR